MIVKRPRRSPNARWFSRRWWPGERDGWFLQEEHAGDGNETGEHAPAQGLLALGRGAVALVRACDRALVEPRRWDGRARRRRRTRPGSRVGSRVRVRIRVGSRARRAGAALPVRAGAGAGETGDGGDLGAAGLGRGAGAAAAAAARGRGRGRLARRRRRRRRRRGRIVGRHVGAGAEQRLEHRRLVGELDALDGAGIVRIDVRLAPAPLDVAGRV